MYQLVGTALLLLFSLFVQAKDQRYQSLTASTQTVAQKTISDQPVSYLQFAFKTEGKAWLSAMHIRLKEFMPEQKERNDFLRTVYYEAIRAGLNPQLVLSVIQVESDFKKYAVSIAGARGYMQIMPFWVKTIGSKKDHNLFHLRVNLRYGCTILRHYLDIEQGNYFRALGRYNGSLGKSVYPQRILNAWRNTWVYPSATMPS